MAETSLESETLNLLFGVLVSTFQKNPPFIDLPFIIWCMHESVPLALDDISSPEQKRLFLLV